MKFSGMLFLAVAVAATAAAQRPRPVDKTTPTVSTDASKARPAPAPQSMKAKYEGGVFGYTKTMDGTLSFDDTNQRLLFRKGPKEIFIPYSAVNSVFADTQKRRPSAATVAQNVPYIGWPLGFIKTKVRYLTVQFQDQDTNVSGVTSFRLENKDVLDSVVFTLAEKAGLEQRGEIFVRKRGVAEATKLNP
jgi:hypothetical protein